MDLASDLEEVTVDSGKHLLLRFFSTPRKTVNWESRHNAGWVTDKQTRGCG
jgi:hypothetical protein